MAEVRPAPWRIQFDQARDPYTARNVLGITSTGGGGGAPTGAEYITAATDPTLSAERVLTDTATVTWDFSTPGQAKASTAAGGGNVSNSGTPAANQYARWVTSTTIQGVSAATVLSDISAQPLDADLTAIAALTGTNTIYYRSAANTWSAVTVSTGLSFTGGALTCTVTSGTPGGSNTQVQFNDSSAFGGDADLTWNKTTNVLTLAGQLTITGAGTSVLAAAVVEAASFKCTSTLANFATGSAGSIVLRPNGPASATGQVQINSTGAVVVNGNIELGAATDTTLSRVSAGVVAIEGQNILTAATGQPLDADLTAIAALTGTNDIYYRSAANTWTSVTIGSNLTFTGGTLAATAGGGSSVTVVVQTFTASGTYTPTASMKYCTIECVGGGGGGGGVGDSTGIAWTTGGGGSGGYSRKTVSAATVGASQAVTIGVAGTAGTAAGANGGAGGTTSVGTLCVANGGGGGTGHSAASSWPGGAGGVIAGAAGDVIAAGNPGQSGISQNQGNISSSNGGASYFGGGGRGGQAATGASAVGGAASNHGGGGGAAIGTTVATTRAGGVGAAGFVIITEYI